jgi:hypothetical protein
MSREHILHEHPKATEPLGESRLGHWEALQSYFKRYLRLNGGDGSAIFSVDVIHSEFV